MARGRRCIHLVIPGDKRHYVLPCHAGRSPAVEEHQRRLLGRHEEV